jgi:hypothetical protein
MFFFSKLFRGKLQLSLTFFRGKISAEFSQKYSAQKLCTESAPGAALSLFRGCQTGLP